MFETIEKKMSLTAIGIVVVAAALTNAGLSDGCSQEVGAWVVGILGAALAWYGRLRKGDITWYGARK